MRRGPHCRLGAVLHPQLPQNGLHVHFNGGLVVITSLRAMILFEAPSVSARRIDVSGCIGFWRHHLDVGRYYTEADSRFSVSLRRAIKLPLLIPVE